jgi:anthranilate phosphoribosyltransferase
LDGYDEISLTGDFKLISSKREQILSPESIGFSTSKPKEIDGGNTIEQAAQIFMDVLRNEASDARRNAVLVNAGFAIHCAKPKLSIEESIGTAKEAIESGNALKCFKSLIK